MTLQMDGKATRTVSFDPSEFRQFDHGYAVTSHSSQGLTAGRVLAHIDTDSPRSLINSRLAYVSISRASDDVRLYTNNAETLGERLSSDLTKTAAVEFHEHGSATLNREVNAASRSHRSVTEIIPKTNLDRVVMPAKPEIDPEQFSIGL